MLTHDSRRATALAVALAWLSPFAPGAMAGPARDLLDQVQRRTLRYFWEDAHPVSGMAPERTSTPEVVTTGGTGFGLMALLVGAERGWMPRAAVRGRVRTVLDFLRTADRFHGVWPHWLDGTTGKTRPFSAQDDGADLVETAFLVQGMLACREFFDGAAPEEAALRAAVDELVGGVEWAWFTQGQDVLYWHWSPNHGFAMNLPIRGWHEGLIVYLLAAGASTAPVPPSVYHRGWAGGDHFRNGEVAYGETLPLGPHLGGPLFLAHYSFLGLDPRGLVDRYADYGEQVKAHARVNWGYCAEDPKDRGFSRRLWGLTASDDPEGYAAHSPTEDRGVLAPTAALASFPYTPRRSWGALLAMRRWQGGKLWGPRGFADAFQPSTGWVAADQLAIDQGPIVVMIENHRSQLLWRLLGRAPELRRGLQRLGFTRRATDSERDEHAPN